MILKVFILLFGIFAVSRSHLRYKDRLLTMTAALFWILLWTLIILSVMFKEETSSLAQYFGIGRGADLLLFGAVLFLSYLSFRLYVRVEELRQELTRLIRALAIREVEEDRKKNNNRPSKRDLPGAA